MTKFVFITGGVVSSLGKGITSASLALLLKRRGYHVAMQKLDPYLNVDPGTMSPYQHGEVFVTDDGAETDLDLGHYERFAGITCHKGSNYTSGKIYSNVINRERAGDYLGGTVQVIPHITDEIKKSIRSAAKNDVDIALIEIGGTAGDIESLPFLEAARQFRQDVGRGNAVFLHLALLPYLRAAGELKTKPAQQSVGILHSLGIFPELLICRTEVPMTEDHRDKLSLFCNMPPEQVIEERDVEHTIYEVPTELAAQGLDRKVLKLLDLPANELQLDDWRKIIDSVIHPEHEVCIALVGKYSACRDAYKSIYESLGHAGIALRTKVKILPVPAESLENGGPLPGRVDGIVVPGGFGQRGVEGKLHAIELARKTGIPVLGICLGMQCMVIEYARHVLGLSDAHSSEFSETTQHPVVDLMPDQRGVAAKGGTMRLGAYPCKLAQGSRAAELYGNAELISERHRHRYEFNNLYRDEFSRGELRFSGESPDGKLIEMVELKSHPFFVGCQFHPEFKSRPDAPHPLFYGLVEAALKRRREEEQKDNLEEAQHAEA